MSNVTPGAGFAFFHTTCASMRELYRPAKTLPFVAHLFDGSKYLGTLTVEVSRGSRPPPYVQRTHPHDLWAMHAPLSAKLVPDMTIRIQRFRRVNDMCYQLEGT